jgi:hypothetical protein
MPNTTGKVKVEVMPVYKVIVRNARDIIEGRMEIAATNRYIAELAGNDWANRRGMTGFRTTVIRKREYGEWAKVMVAS